MHGESTCSPTRIGGLSAIPRTPRNTKTSRLGSSLNTCYALRQSLSLFALLLQLAHSPPFGGFGSRLGVHQVVPPSEAARVIADESFMVDVMVVGAAPEGQKVPQAVGKVVAAVRVNGLEQSAHNP